MCWRSTLGSYEKTFKINDEQYYFLRQTFVAGYNDPSGVQRTYPVGNARNVQPLNDRVFYTCRNGEESSDDSDEEVIITETVWVS